MTEKIKLNVGDLPAQTEDYSRFEETSLRWGRLALLVVSGILIFTTLYWLFFTDEKPAGTVEKQAVSQQQNKPAVINPVEMTQAIPVPPKAQVKPPAKTKRQTPTSASPIHILNPGIIRAQLSSDLQKGLPIDKLGNFLSMSEQGIIKVVLFTEINDLRGKVLYHDWYRNGLHQARVKIPVNVSPQRSSSSKYINLQMLGAWQVKVVDEHDELYLQADFEVTEK